MIRTTRLALLVLSMLGIFLSIFAQGAVKWLPLPHAHTLCQQARCFLFGKPRLQFCHLNLQWVCGSNGKTYSNACFAKKDCQFKWTQGACPTEE